MNERYDPAIPEGWPRHFRGRGYRVTMPRRVILKILQHAEKHLSAEEIFIRAYKMHPAIGLTTIYRTLDFLTKNGIVIKTESGEGRSRYELAERKQGFSCHQHLICMNCRTFLDSNELTEAELRVIKGIKERIDRKYQFSTKSCILHFYGECGNCKS